MVLFFIVQAYNLLVVRNYIMALKGPISAIHSKMFDIDEKELGLGYFNFLSNYKIVTLAFMVAPYIALKIMGQ